MSIDRINSYSGYYGHLNPITFSLDDILNLAELPPARKVEVVVSIQYWLDSFSEIETPAPHPCFDAGHTMTKEDQQQEFLSIVGQYSSEDLVALFAIATPFIKEYEPHLSGTRGFEIKKFLLDTLKTIPLELRQKALSNAQEELRAMPVDETKLYHVFAYLRYPQAVPLFRGRLIDEVFSLYGALDFLPDGMQEFAINTVVTLLPECKDMNLVSCALRNYSDQKLLQTIGTALPQLLGLSSSDEILSRAYTIYFQDCKDDNLISYVALHYNDKEMLNTVEIALPQLLGLSSHDEIEYLAKAICRELVTVADPLLQQCLDVDEKVFVYNALSSHPEAIAEVIQRIPSDLDVLRSIATHHPKHKFRAGCDLVRTFSAKHDIKQFLLINSSPYFGQVWNDGFLRAVDQLFAKTPQEAHKEIAESIISLLSQGTNYSFLIDRLLLTPGDQVLTSLHLFQKIQDTTTWIYVMHLIYSTRPEEARQVIMMFMQVMPLLQKIPDRSTRHSVIKLICHMQVEEAEQKLPLFVQAAPLLQGGNLEDPFCNFIVEKIKFARPNEDVEAYFVGLIRLKECVTQADFFRNVYGLMYRHYLGSSVNRIADILESITNLPVRGAVFELLRNDRVETYEELLQFIPESERRTEILQLIYNLEGSSIERERLLYSLLEAMPEEQTSDAQYIHLRAMLLGLQEQIVRDAYSFNVDRKDLRDQPLKLLAELTALVLQHPARTLRVTFNNEEGIDAGGPGREYITGLIDGLIEALQFSKQKTGLYLPMEYKQEHAQSFEQLGMLFMFVLNATREYPIGMVFDHVFFQALLKVKANPTFSELVELYCLMTNNDELKLYANPFTAQTDEKTLTRALAFTMLEDEFEGKDLKEHYATLYAALQTIINDEFLVGLKPLLAIVKGMQNSPFTKVTWQDVQKLSSASLSASLQGRLNHELVLSKLKFHESISKEQQVLIQNWVKAADLKQLANFVYGITGAKALGNTDLKIEKAFSLTPSFCTCFFRVSLPIEGVCTQQAMNEVIDNALLGIENDRFNRG